MNLAEAGSAELSAALMSDWSRRHGMPFPINQRIRYGDFRDTQVVAAAAATKVPFFANGSTSTAAGNADGPGGCNLDNSGELPGNNSILVERVTMEILGVTDATILGNAFKFIERGYLESLVVRGDIVLEDICLADLADRAGIVPASIGEGSAAGVVSGAVGVGVGFELPPEARFVIAPNDKFVANVIHTAALGAQLTSVRLRLWGPKWRQGKGG